MAYIALYRKYRPQTFSSVFGQEHIVSTIQSAIDNNKVAHAYLFNGPRGTGKTTIARLIAKAVNCTGQGHKPCGECESCRKIQSGTHPDIVEIDAASNNGVEEIRELIENVKYTPMEAKTKVYIIDEVHMLSANAFNALLKTLEDPPGHVIFILATTEAHKVLPTIISRCQRFDFSKVDNENLSNRLKEVLDAENIKYDDELLDEIAVLSDGGMRDALSILDQLVAYCEESLDTNSLYKIYGLLSKKEKVDLLVSINKHDVSAVLMVINKISDQSLDIRRLTNELVEILKETIVYSLTNNEKLLSVITKDQAVEIIDNVSVNRLLKYSDLLLETADKYRNASNANLYFENCLLKMVEYNESSQTEEKEKTKNSTKEVKKAEKQEEYIEENYSEEKVIIEDNEEEVTSDFYLSLFSRASKSEKIMWEENWDKLNDYRLDDNYKVLANGLLQTKVFVAGDDYLIVVSPHDEIIQQLNQKQFNDHKVLLAKEISGKYCKVFVINKEFGKQLLEKFKKSKKNGKEINASEKFSFDYLKNPKKISKHPIYEIFDKENVEEV